MNKYIKILIIILVVIVILVIATYITKNSNLNKSEENKQENIINSIENISIIPQNEISMQVKETEISSFSTNLAGDANRLENIRISCNKINGTILKNRESFSFNDIIGEPTEDKGYKEADVLVETTLTKGFGGGNCQVSSTLYNACLAVPEIEVTERHPHKKKVAYVEEGKDASVSYGILDLKFINNTGSSIKIYMNSDDNKVTAKIVKL